jgi:hypothetical protein
MLLVYSILHYHNQVIPSVTAYIYSNLSDELYSAVACMSTFTHNYHGISKTWSGKHKMARPY